MYRRQKQYPLKRESLGFTLIELLIVVAIIAILAAIAVPNFLEAQIRSKVSRVKADARTYATAMEAYMVDWNQYPLVASPNMDTFATPASYQPLKAYVALSTPVSYVTAGRMIDIFRESQKYMSGSSTVLDDSNFYQFASGNSKSKEASMATLSTIMGGHPEKVFPRDVYAIVSMGPDHFDSSLIGEYPFSYAIPYDPTNGSVSLGDIYRCGPGDLTPRGWKGGSYDPPY